MYKKFLYYFLVILIINNNIKNAESGPLSCAICYAGCAALWCACYAAAGSVAGTVTAGVGKNIKIKKIFVAYLKKKLGTAPAILACNAALGKCMAACAAGNFLTIVFLNFFVNFTF
jgi:hypothetical protein